MYMDMHKTLFGLCFSRVGRAGSATARESRERLPAAARAWHDAGWHNACRFHGFSG
jgi:hypothetical protein